MHLAPQSGAVLRLPTLRPQYPYAITDQGFNLRDRVFNVTVRNFWALQQFVADLHGATPWIMMPCRCLLLSTNPLPTQVAWNVMPRVGALYTRQRKFTGVCAWPTDGLELPAVDTCQPAAAGMRAQGQCCPAGPGYGPV